MAKPVDGAKLELAYKISAGIVRDHGEVYLPIFKRMHEEVIQYHAKQDLVQLALNVSSNRCE